LYSAITVQYGVLPILALILELARPTSGSWCHNFAVVLWIATYHLYFSRAQNGLTENGGPEFDRHEIDEPENEGLIVQARNWRTWNWWTKCISFEIRL